MSKIVSLNELPLSHIGVLSLIGLLWYVGAQVPIHPTQPAPIVSPLHVLTLNGVRMVATGLKHRLTEL